MGTISDKVEGAKAWYQSKTIIGTILMFIPTVVRLFAPDVDVDAVGTVDEVFNGAEGVAAYADSVWATAQEALGFVIAVYGRIKAKAGIR